MSPLPLTLGRRCAAASLADRGWVTSWLAHRRQHIDPTCEAVEVHELRRISRGVSRETWVVQLSVDGRQRRLAVRRDPPQGTVIPVSLRFEYDVYARLAATDVPVARALWFEEDPEWQPDGRPAYLRELVDGDWRLPEMDDASAANDDVRIARSKAHLEALATVHRVDWQAADLASVLPVAPQPADAATAVLDHLEDRIAEVRVAAEPLLDTTIELLRATASASPAVVLCKGTNGIGEEVWRDGRIVAMSDWELAWLGDPAYDLAQTQGMVPEIVRDGERIWGWSEALAHHAAHAGVEVTPDRLDWYRHLYGVLQYLYCEHARRLVVVDGVDDLRLLWTATEVHQHAREKLLATTRAMRGR